MYANVPDNFYEPHQSQSAPRGTYAKAVKELASYLPDVISDAKFDGLPITSGTIRRGLRTMTEHLATLDYGDEEGCPFGMLEPDEWDNAIDEVMAASPLFAECGSRSGRLCSVSADRCAA